MSAVLQRIIDICGHKFFLSKGFSYHNATIKEYKRLLKLINLFINIHNLQSKLQFRFRYKKNGKFQWK